ncbi:COX assembly mitochondrial protein [Trichuris trichiura]|uniref:COX assembly mitochondrial protein n=1 Tax=Trichuris trichiura TaxID=36087 RepID=A0A077Z1N4_TRITR|nr:COX assembly mitochondrial protein [Trichuris trichiura]
MMDASSEKSRVHVEKTVLPASLNDPNDLSLRHVERDVVIPNRVRDRVKKEKCSAEYAQLDKCMSQFGMSRIWRCYKTRDTLNTCLLSWYYDPDFVQECTVEYLEDRSEYRRTGRMSERLRKQMGAEAFEKIEKTKARARKK